MTPSEKALCSIEQAGVVKSVELLRHIVRYRMDG